MTNDTPKKTCTKCKIEKSIEDFYEQAGMADGHMSVCKICTYRQQQERRLSPNFQKKTKRDAQNKEEGLLQQALRSMGIYAAPGKASEWNWIDSVAWGCVKIELKSAEYNPATGYNFTFSPKQSAVRFCSDIICLMCIRDQKISYHLFPSNHQVFFKPNGKRKRGISWNPGRSSLKHYKRFGLSLSDSLMNEHLDNWSLIETVRNRISMELKNEVYDADKSILQFESQKKLAGF